MSYKKKKKMKERKHARTRPALGAAVKENVKEQNCHSNTAPLPTAYTFLFGSASPVLTSTFHPSRSSPLLFYKRRKYIHIYIYILQVSVLPYVRENLFSRKGLLVLFGKNHLRKHGCRAFRLRKICLMVPPINPREKETCLLAVRSFLSLGLHVTCLYVLQV